MERVIDRLSNHYIVCGFGRMGAQIGRELTRRELAFVVIERDPIVLEMLRANGVLHIEGDATSDSILLTAGVAHARGLATALSGDADNALVVISAKGLNPNTIQIKATASQKGRVGCGQPLCSGRLSRHFDILRLTTRGLER
jgi:voltage-gated potassium channel